MGLQMQSHGIQSMLKEGHKHLSGLDEAVLKNIDACKQLSLITRTSLGPNGISLSLSLSLHFVLYLGMDTNVINSFRQPSKCLCDSKNSNLLFNFIFGNFFLANYRTFRSSSSLVYLVFGYGHKSYQSFRQPVCDQWCCHLIIVIVSLQ